MGQERSITLDILCVLVFAVLWSPALTDDKCTIGCKGTSGAPSFLNSHKYEYAVDGVVSIFLTGADKQETRVKLNGHVSVAGQGNCAYVLRVQNIQISGPDGKKYNKPTGIEKPVQFSIEDGKVGSEICTEEGDTRRSLNIKRAIISLLQTPTKQSTETDVFGVCPTQVSSSEEGGASLIHRSRDLSRCGFREQGRNDLITGVFDPQAEIKSTEVLQSTLNVESKVKNGVPEKIAAIEEYLYKPFSAGQNGARATVQTKLTLTGQSAGTDTGKFTEAKSIIFDNPHGFKSEQSNLQHAVHSLKDTAKTLQHEASSKSAGEFAQLVRILRYTSKDDLVKLYNQVKGNKLEKRVYLDALLRAGTGASIETSIQLLKNKELHPIEQKLVFLSLGNAKHATDDALKAAAGLLDIPNIPKEVYLGVGALAGVYCRSHQCHGHGSQSPGIAALSQKLASKLHNCKTKSKVEEDYIVAALKGIRNIRHIEDSLVDRISQCVTDKNVKARVKVAALEGILADPCTPKLKKVAIDTMKNRQLDSEIRIKAYLAVIACPCAKTATEIKLLIENEPVHQVARFISTSLRHIRASANPDKQLAKQHYGLIRIPPKFEVDDRKYSFYRELSFDIDTLGVGGVAEASVIYSQDSFLPRSATFNLTTELFGHNLNIFEVGGRQGNLDRVIEHFLGPKSFLRTQSPQEIYDNLKHKLSEIEETAEEKLRRKRHLKNDIESFDKQVKAEEIPYNYELDLDLYVKLFGTDAVFLSLGDDKGFNPGLILNQIVSQLYTGFAQAKNFQHEVRSHLLFLDAELSYPTSVGFPLRLDLIGSATGRFDVSTNLDIKQIIRDPKNAKVDIKLIPSTDIEITGVFLVDADVVSTGLKVVTNFHSSTGGHFVAKVLENGQGFDIHFGLPIDKQEIITASTDVVLFTREKGQKDKDKALKIDTEKKEYSGCFDQLSPVIGLTFCGEVSVPFSVSGQDAQASIQKFIGRYPLTGPAKIKVHVEKNDLRGYHLKYVFHDNAGKQGFELLFEAEGGKKRKTLINGELVNTNEEKSIQLNLESPITVINSQVSLLMKPTEYAALVRFKWDVEEYFGRAGFSVSGDQRHSVFKPVLEYQMPGSEGKKSIKVDGEIVKEVNGPNTKYSLKGIKVVMPNTNEMVDINGYFVRGPKSEVELKANNREHNGVIKGSFSNKEGYLEFKNTLNEFINFKVKGKYDNDRVKNHYQNDFELFYGKDLNSETNHVTFNQLLKYHQNSKDDFSVVTKNKFNFPMFPVVAKVEAEVDPKKFELQVFGQYLESTAEVDVKARTHIKRQGDYNVKVEVKGLRKGIEVFAKRDFVDADKSNFENYISIKDLGKYELSGVVTHKIKSKDINIGANGHLRLKTHQKQQDIKFDFGLQQNDNIHASHLKLNTDKEIVNYFLKINTGANPNGEFKLVLLDTLATNGQYKVTDTDGKGNGGFIVHFKKADRKFKGDVKFVAKEPVFNADVDLFLNFGKDNNDKIHFSTNNKVTNKLIDSKNKLVVANKKAELNLKLEGEVEGKGQGFVELVIPPERVISFKFNKNTESNGDIYKGFSDIEVSDAPQRNAKASKIIYKDKYDVDANRDIGNYEGEFGIYLKDSKDWVQTIVLKNNPVSDKKYKAEFKHEIKGSLMAAPYAASGFVEYLNDDNVIDGPVTYLLKTNYGDQVHFSWDGKYEVALFDSGDKKYAEDFTLTLKSPSTPDLKLVSSVLYLLPENQDIILDYTVANTLHVNNEQYKFDASGKIAKSNGFNKVKVVVPHEDPYTLDTSYKNSGEGEKKKTDIEIKSNYGKGKTANVHISGISHSAREHSLEVKATAPHAEHLKKLEFSIHSKNPSADTYNVNVIVDADGKVVKTDVLVLNSKVNPVVDAKFSYPNAKDGRVYFKYNTISQYHYQYETKLENIGEFNLNGEAELSLEKDNFLLSASGTCPQLGWENMKSKFASKDNRLEIHAENKNKVILSGSTSYISKQEGPKTIIEGSGSVKLNDQQKSATFKYIRTILTEGTEQGIENFLNLGIGDHSEVLETRFTNLESKISYVSCEEKKQCAHAEFNSKINAADKKFQHLVNMVLDLRKLGVSPEFGLELKNEVTDTYALLSTLDVHLNAENKKYHLHIYNKPRQGGHIGYESGAKVELPTRTLGVESVFSAGSKGVPFPLDAEVSMYLNKDKPQQKVSAKVHMDLTGNEKQHTFKADIKFHHPKIPQDAGVSLQGSLRHESYDNFMFEGIASATQRDQSKVFIEVKPNHLKLFINTPIVKVIDAEGSLVVKDNHQEGSIKFGLLDGKPVQIKAVAKDFQYFEFTTGYSDEAQRKLSIIGHIETDKRIDISADIILPGAKKNIGHGAVFLKDDNIKTDYGASKENFEYFIKALKGDIDQLRERLAKLSQKSQVEFKKRFDSYKNNVKKIGDDYRQEIEKLKQELDSDQTLQKINKVFGQLVHAFAGIIDTVVQGTSHFANAINNVISNTWENIVDNYSTKIQPLLEKFYNNVYEALKGISDPIIEILSYFGAIIADFAEKHKPELKELTDALAGIFKSLTHILVEKLKEFRAVTAGIIGDLTQQIKDLPMVAFLKEKISELLVPEKLIQMVNDVHQGIQVILPTDESRQLAEAIVKYLHKKIRNEKFDESAELRIISEKATATFSSIINFAKKQLSQLGLPSIINLNFIPILSGPSQSIPSFGAPVSFSIINQLLSGEIPNPIEYIRSYRPRSFNPLDEIPAKLRGVVVNGQHIFTFDGAHLTFPGNCRYVLAHDHVDRNFTVVLELKNGQPKSIAVEDKSGAIVEIKENGQVALNGANHGFPAQDKDVVAFKDVNGIVGIKSNYGLLVRCNPKLTVCYVEISGFYLGKLRGLLGDGNNEPYDDFRLPNNKIVTSPAEFGHAYRLTTSCPQVKVPEHSHHQLHAALPSECEEVFGAKSTLWPLSIFLDIAPFRQACIHAVASNKAHAQEEACDLARGYAALAVTGLLPAIVPEICVKCHDADKVRNVGDSYQLTLPNKQADVVVLVETTKSNEKLFKELLLPVVSQVVDSLKQKHIDDIQVHLLGMSSSIEYPIIYDTENVKLKGAKIAFTDESRYKPCVSTIHFNNENIDKYESIIADLYNDFIIKIGANTLQKSYNRVYNLPLRAGAVKSFISLIGETCKKNFLLVDLARIASAGTKFYLESITHSIITNTPNMKLTDKPVDQVIGYDSSSVFLLGDKKKGKDTQQLRTQLLNVGDSCIDIYEATNGIVFSASNFAKFNGGQQKQFTQTTAHVIVDHMTRTQVQQECVCTYVDSFNARSICLRVNEKDIARRRK